MKRFRNGEHVIVPWGLDEVHGVVVDMFGPPGNPFVTVRVVLGNDDDSSAPTDIGFRASDLRPAETASPG